MNSSIIQINSMFENKIEGSNIKRLEEIIPEDTELRLNILKISEYLLNQQSIELNLLITDDETIKKINLGTRKKDSVTDVLSFPYSDLKIKLPHVNLGEIVISIESADKQAVMVGHTFKEEFYRLLVHGFLHLLGFDHEKNQEDEIEMQKMEDECLSILFD